MVSYGEMEISPYRAVRTEQGCLEPQQTLVPLLSQVPLALIFRKCKKACIGMKIKPIK